MAQSKRSNGRTVPRNQNSDFKGFVNLDLSKQQKETLKKAEFTLDHVEDCLVKLNEAGYKVSFNFDSFNDCYGCFIMPATEKSPNAGYILPGRGSTPIKALKQAYYKHSVLLEGDWSEASIGKKEEIDD